MKKTIINTLAIVLIVSTTTAFGEVREGAFSVTPVAGSYVYDSKQHLDTSVVLGVRAGYNITDSFGIEAFYDYVTRSNVSSMSLKDISSQRYGGQALYNFFPDNVLVPYLAAGYSRVNFGGAGVNNASHGEFDYGAGVKYFLTDDIAVRGDIRHALYSYNSTNFNNVEFTTGVHFQFGGDASAVKTIVPASVKPSTTEPALMAAPVPHPTACEPVACPSASESVKYVFEPVTEAACETLKAAAQLKASQVVVVPRSCEIPPDISITYGPDRVIFKEDYRDELDKMGNFLNDFPNSSITIVGHTSP